VVEGCRILYSTLEVMNDEDNSEDSEDAGYHP
jgi:hypothetical protein